jgi:glycosyltransferase involved in cell wall biosynthesis
MQPLVSILIPCYNAGPWIAQCIQSALGQTYPHKEVVVVDDGSHDNSLNIIRSFGDRIRFETGPNRGGNVARNRLMQLSNGDWLEFLDADDFLLPSKIEKQIVLLVNQPGLDVIYSPTLHIYADLGKEFVTPLEDDDLYANFFRWAYFSTTSLLLKKSAIMDVGGWKESQKVCQEHELILRLILAEKSFALMPEALGVNRIQYVSSVSRRSPLKTLMHKMDLVEHFESYLLSRGEMNEVRRLALGQARFEAARAAYFWDKQYAEAMMTRARESVSMSQFKGVNLFYRWAVRLVGFDLAERIACVRRRLFRRSVVVLDAGGKCVAGGRP